MSGHENSNVEGTQKDSSKRLALEESCVQQTVIGNDEFEKKKA